MKIQSSITTALLACLCTAVAQNPFVNKTADAVSPVPPGDSYSSLVESIAVPAAVLDAWLREHPPVKDDAAALRDTAQSWISEGKATLQHLSLGCGTEHRYTRTASILEVIYPTEFVWEGPDVWPTPAAFDTRNTGYSADSGLLRKDGDTAILSEIERVEMESNRPWNLLMERTRKEQDVFIPSFRSHKLIEWEPGSPEANHDPFASPNLSPRSPNPAPAGVKFQPGKVQLAARFDMEPGSPGTDALLYFHRGTILPKETTSATDRARSGQEISRVTFRAVKVGTAAAMEWLRSVQPEAIQSDAWARVLGLEKIGAVTLLSELSSKAAPGLPFNVESVREMSYPTEWRPAGGKTAKKEAEDKNITDPAQLHQPPSRPGLADASLGISFDTRNLGVSAEATLTLADDGLLLKYRWSRVNHAATSVHRRILVDGDWIPDVTMPVFSSQGIESTLRLAPGKWTLAGLTPHVNEAGKFDRENCLFLFVKVD